jgi:hypothetical protein
LARTPPAQKNSEDAPLSVFGENPNGFPKLPILSAAEIPKRTQREKYGGLFYLGIAGLAFMIALVSWFGYGVWSHRDIWADVYVLNDRKRSDVDRVQAAFRLSQDPRVTDSQRMEMSLQRDLPDLARYLLAEAVSTEQLARDPRGYALTVARSRDWPDWLRLLLARRLAYGAGRAYAIPQEALDELAQHADPMIRLWATYSQVVQPGSDPQKLAELETAAEDPSDLGVLARSLLRALHAAGMREQRLDEASSWLRRHHPQAISIWNGWRYDLDGLLVRAGAN